jgi:hypothetical protein
VSEWLLFNAYLAIFQLYYGEIKLIFDEMIEMMIRFWGPLPSLPSTFKIFRLWKKSSTIKFWSTFCDQSFWKFPIWNSRADEKCREMLPPEGSHVCNGKLLLPCEGHLGYAIGTKITNLVEDHPVIISIMLQFHQLRIMGDFNFDLQNKNFRFSDFMEHTFSSKQIVSKVTRKYESLLGLGVYRFWFCSNILYSWWRPFWISDPHKNKKVGRGPPSHHLYNVTIPSAE